MRTVVVILINIILVAAAILTSLYSMDHYADGGCDGGLCGLGLLFHALPLALVWLLLIIAFNLSLRKKGAALVLIALALVINTLVYSQNHGYALQELDLEPQVLFFIAAVCLALFFREFDFNKTPERNSDPDGKKENKKTHPLLVSAILVWILSNLFFYFMYLFSSGRYQAENNMLSTLLGVCIWVVQFTLIYYTYKGRLWSLFILFAFVLYQCVMILVYNFKYETVFYDYVLVACDLYFLFVLALQYLRQKNTSPTEK